MKKLLTLLVCSLMAIATTSAGNIASGSFSGRGSWTISDSGELYVDVPAVPDYTTAMVYGMERNGCFRYNWADPRTCAPWGNYANQITSIRFSNRVTEIGANAFTGLDRLTRVTFVARNTANVKIGDEAFAFCYALNNFDFSYVTELGRESFWGCNFERVTLPAITKVGSMPFRDCEDLLRAADDYAPSIILTGTTIPTIEDAFTGLKKEMQGVMRGCDVVRFYDHKIVISAPVALESQIPEQSAVYCEEWTTGGSIPVNNIYPPYWCHIDYYLRVYTGMGCMPDYASATAAPWSTYKNHTYQIEITSKDAIGDNAFSGFTSLNRVTKIANVTKIGEKAFYNCSKLAKIDLKNITVFGKSAFEGCTKLEVIHFSKDVQTINANAFANTGVTDIYVYGPCPTTSVYAFGDDLSSITLHVPAEYASSYNVSPWKEMTKETVVNFPVSGSNWTLSQNGKLTISANVPNYNSASDQPWYAYHEFIYQIVAENNVTSIGNNAFASTGNLKAWDVEIPNVTTIGANAFKGNVNLFRITGEKVQTVGDQAFAQCSGLEEVNFGDNLTSLGNKVFDGCPAIAKLGVEAFNPPTVTSQTFDGMGASASNAPGRNGVRKVAGQKSVTLEVPESATASYMATPYWNMFSFIISGEHGSLVTSGNFGDGMYTIWSDSTLLISCTSLETGSGLQDQTSVHDWGTYASKIKRIEVLGELPELYRSFNNLPNLESVVFSSSVKKLYSTFRNCPKLKDIPLNDVEEFREYGNLGCFEKCNALTEVKLQNARIIGYRCFAECANLKTVEFPNADTIANVAFVSCPKLEGVTVNNAYIGNAFRGCTGLKEVTLNSVKGQVIPAEAFDGCTSLKTVRIYGSLHKVENDAFDGCTALTDIYLSSPYPADVANKYNSNVFRGVTLSQVNLHVPSDFVTRYSSSYNNPIWSQMNVVADTDFSEPMIPTGGALGSYGTWELGTNQKLFINCSDSMPTAQSAFGKDSYADTWYDWMPYVSAIEFSKTT